MKLRLETTEMTGWRKAQRTASPDSSPFPSRSAITFTNCNIKNNVPTIPPTTTYQQCYQQQQHAVQPVSNGHPLGPIGVSTQLECTQVLRRLVTRLSAVARGNIKCTQQHTNSDLLLVNMEQRFRYWSDGTGSPRLRTRLSQGSYTPKVQ